MYKGIIEVIILHIKQGMVYLTLYDPNSPLFRLPEDEVEILSDTRARVEGSKLNQFSMV